MARAPTARSAHRPRDRRREGERVRSSDPRRTARGDLVRTRRFERPASADQLSCGGDWSKSKPGSSSQGGSGVDSSREISPGPPVGSASGGAREGISSQSRIRRATSGSVIADKIRIRPPHAGQRSASTSKTRWRRSAQTMRRRRPKVVAGRESCSWLGVGANEETWSRAPGNRVGWSAPATIAPPSTGRRGGASTTDVCPLLEPAEPDCWAPTPKLLGKSSAGRSPSPPVRPDTTRSRPLAHGASTPWYRT